MTDAREDGKAAAVGVERDLVYLEAGRAERLDLYRPGVRAGLLPAVVVLHGGGWQGGDKQFAGVKPLFEPLSKAGFAWFSTAEVSDYYQRRIKIMREADPVGHVAASKRIGW